jgi:hypothetical protein
MHEARLDDFDGPAEAPLFGLIGRLKRYSL